MTLKYISEMKKKITSAKNKKYFFLNRENETRAEVEK